MKIIPGILVLIVIITFARSTDSNLSSRHRLYSDSNPTRFISQAPRNTQVFIFKTELRKYASTSKKESSQIPSLIISDEEKSQAIRCEHLFGKISQFVEFLSSKDPTRDYSDIAPKTLEIWRDIQFDSQCVSTLRLPSTFISRWPNFQCIIDYLEMIGEGIGQIKMDIRNKEWVGVTYDIKFIIDVMFLMTDC